MSLLKAMSSGQPNTKRAVAAVAKANDNLILAFHMAQAEADELEALQVINLSRLFKEL